MRNSKSRFSQMLTALFVAVAGIALIQNYSFVNQSFVSGIFSVILSVLLLLLCIVPTLIVRSKSELSFINFAMRETPSAIVFISMFYALYFVYSAVHFLLKYSDVCTSTGNRRDAGFVVVFIMLAVCAFAASKGIGAVARCSLLVFAFAVVAFALIFSGNISNLDFSSFSFELSGGRLQYGTAVFASISFAAVVLGMFEYDRRIKTKSIFTLLCGISVFLVLVVFFVFFALGKYGTMQSFQLFVLSKSAKIGDVGGFDSFHMSLCAMAVFVLVSLCLICIDRVVQKDKCGWCTVIFAAIAYLFYLTADNYNSVKEIILNPYVFDIFTVLASFAVPMIYITVFWRRLDA